LGLGRARDGVVECGGVMGRRGEMARARDSWMSIGAGDLCCGEEGSMGNDWLVLQDGARETSIRLLPQQAPMEQRRAPSPPGGGGYVNSNLSWVRMQMGV
jgi:hypothetical protein